MSTYTMPTCAETDELLESVVEYMVTELGVSRAEAVARVNRQWHGQDLSDEDDIILHEEERFWALTIYYEDVPAWSTEADRASWVPKAPPAPDSVYWTVATS
ncbi:hypothetical protein OKJ48_02825 [Streptomyces kunmingensis]|uniref:Uncharacterized protein n=1 Tax=Streptomyces kunmingensis TaxID=68225 RepID=A0ABU6C5V1_9ACTN|nr:hypothetical protein [Streptomyces kunmingensis]MEB3959195.1 hypothetical protein [Streptomyces kunmingensis]